MSDTVIPVEGEAVKRMPTFSRRSFIFGCTAAAVCAALPAFAAYEVKPVVTNDYTGVKVTVNYDKSRIAPYPDNYDRSAIGESFGYVRRSEEHGISGYDWKGMLDFADRAFGK